MFTRLPPGALHLESAAILRYKWQSDQPFPGLGESHAIFVGPTNDLVRPIGILALPRP